MTLMKARLHRTRSRDSFERARRKNASHVCLHQHSRAGRTSRAARSGARVAARRRVCRSEETRTRGAFLRVSNLLRGPLLSHARGEDRRAVVLPRRLLLRGRVWLGGRAVSQTQTLDSARKHPLQFVNARLRRAVESAIVFDASFDGFERGLAVVHVRDLYAARALLR